MNNALARLNLVGQLQYACQYALFENDTKKVQNILESIKLVVYMQDSVIHSNHQTLILLCTCPTCNKEQATYFVEKVLESYWKDQ